ncbi:hypothetical protein SAMN05428995_105257 [Loktanella sp. DSM 29012]|uniref:hypothetical protein n=1 Tax=Loktanella sp. DSM 29012 TaxID=1881056 RepID=UPI0008D3A190|nr:hypothetical protein [Loktanella sp. DSM 29012]SEQ60010.1 hypothetical protein SAMN05428995_105257 [Loktanella sp. DSM 29012]
MPETMLNVTDGDRSVYSVTRAEALALGYPEAAIAQAEAQAAAAAARAAIRATIDRTVGDTPSIVGTLADVSGILTAGQMVRVVALADHASTAAEQAELDMLKALAGYADLVQICRDGLAALQGGQALLTASAKGIDTVFAEAMTRSTATAAILAARKEGEA